MNANVGSTDKIVRLVLALAAVVFAFVTGIGTARGIVLLVVGVVLAATALTGFCPIYRVLGMGICPRASSRPRRHLPGRQLDDMQGLTSPEVATVQGIGLPAAKQRLRRGRALLVSLLAADDDRRLATRGVPVRCWEARSLVGDDLDDELGARERVVLEGRPTSRTASPAGSSRRSSRSGP